ncbi:helix-turn-helix domain-containing protein [Mycobacterium sp. 1482292.6]|uniref:helix-turn-helix domain-containing protein n=1 Tax=Mycobacterium sp. 1482292.6 TaxID=1834081 RepID=UPI0012EA3B99|nr:helix-turn-helix domain-containing protein [Mycobacterium sp. 1482292.6]
MNGSVDESPSGAAPSPIKTYSLDEVAAMVLPPEMKNGRLWLRRRIRSGEARAYKAGRTWRMTHEDVEDLIARLRNNVAPSTPPVREDHEHNPMGLSARSLRYRQRYGIEGNPNLQKPRKKRKPAEGP